jgi:transglutaminase/protease-like cytokinesis protein 3
MKWWLIGLVMVVSSEVRSQSRGISFASIDWKMGNTEAPTPDSLARIVSANFSTELERTRAIYSWITSHIAYNTTGYKPRKAFTAYPADPLDTAAVWPSGDEMTARKAMLRREAVCDGYSRLFKVVCQYAGIEAEIINGYGRTNTTNDSRFRTNHTWNAVRIDSGWYLLDVTWAAGYINFLDDFVTKQNDFYFLTPPELFINDHYPEELRWTLLSQPSTPAEFKKMPFRSKNYSKYDIVKFAPSNGILEAAAGDTITFSLQLNDGERVKKIGADPFVDTSSYAGWPFSAFIKPAAQVRQDVLYTYIVDPKAEWLNLLFNGDVVMRYRIKVKEKKSQDLAGN